MKKILFNLSLAAIALSGLGKARADTETCANPNGTLKVVIHRDSAGDLIEQIELYENNELRASDIGPFRRSNLCHVAGDTIYGKIFSLGGCYQLGDEPAAILTWDRQFRPQSDNGGQFVWVNLKDYICSSD
jgi:hypothetical protein